MYSNIKVQKFDMKELGSRTLEMHTFREDSLILVIGKDVKTNELFVLHEEWEPQPEQSTL